MSEDQRGRSKTQKLCHSSNISSSSQSVATHWRDQRLDRHSPTRNSTIMTKQIRTPGGSIRPKNLNRIKSLSKIEIKSPIMQGLTHFNSNTEGETRPLLSESNSFSSIHSPSLSARLIRNLMPTKFYRLKNFYNDFTTIDWVQAFISQNRLNFELQKRNWIVENNESHIQTKISYLYKTYLIFSKWFLIVLIGFLFSLIAYCIDKLEVVLVGFKYGYCQTNWFASSSSCLDDSGSSNWVTWTKFFEGKPINRLDFATYVSLTIILAMISCSITLSTKITSKHLVSKDSNYCDTSSYASTPNDYDFDHDNSSESSYESDVHYSDKPTKIIYTAAGSGVPEVKTILSGFVIRKFLGTYALFTKTLSLVAAIASGMSLGKEGPYVHLATCVGNICSRLFSHIENNELLKKQILSAAASSGVTLAFGSPIGGVLFILEEINNYLPSNQLFLIFFCSIVSTLFLKFLDPYGTGKTVLFELDYNSDWSSIELVYFVMIGIAGGIFGASFIKFVNWWPSFFRKRKYIKDKPLFEVFLVALLTGIVTFWNPYTKQASVELILDLATPCYIKSHSRSLCPSTRDEFTKELGSLIFAFFTKIFLTFITFGLKLPCGIYIPSMTIGALFGRIFGMIIKWFHFRNSDSAIVSYPFNNPGCIDLGIYSMISAGAFMAGVTRMNVTLVTILFELTSSYNYVLPISIAISVANWIGNSIEPNSLYESLLIMNDYPFMSAESEPLDPFILSGDIINACDTFNGEETSKLNAVTNKRAQYVNQPSQSPRITSDLINEFVPVSDINDNRKLYIDISTSPFVSVSILKSKLVLLAEKSLLDGCIPLVLDERCVGLIFFAELEYCLDKVGSFCVQYGITEDVYCKLLPEDKYHASETTLLLQRSNQSTINNVLQSLTSSLHPSLDYFSYRDANTNDTEANRIQQTFYDSIDLTDSIEYQPIFINYDSELTLANLIFERIGTRVVVLLKNGKYHGVLHKKVLIDYCRREVSPK